MPATRVIIDMQPSFDASNYPEVVIGVTLEIIEAIRQKSPIVILEYCGSGRTHKGLTDLLNGYEHCVYVQKANNGGSKEVIAALKKQKFPFKHLRICGVNTGYCVRETVEGLAKKLLKSKIELVKKACGDSYVDDKYDWRKFPKFSNLKLV